MSAPLASRPPDAAALWADATLAAALFATDPSGLGIVVRSRAGPVRDRWLGIVRSLMPSDAPVRRIPLNISDDRLIGGLDLAASLAAHRPVVGAGVLAEADGGAIILPMAERIDRSTAARIAAVHDAGEVALEREGFSCRLPGRFGIVALDEGVQPEEQPPEALVERLAFHVDLDLLPFAEATGPNWISDADVAAARAAIRAITIDDDTKDALCSTAMALGIPSIRAPLQAMRAAIAHAALMGRAAVDSSDAAVAARLVLAPRAKSLPPAPAEEAPPAPEDRTNEPPSQEPSDADTPAEVPSLDDLIVAAARAAIPSGLLARLQIERAGLARAKESGRSGASRKSVGRGRPAGVRQGRLHAGARLHLIETLRAAAPWQKLRSRLAAQTDGGARLNIRVDDFRIRRHVERAQTTTIFVVDASGSSALNRLAEVKGAVELLLADCYVRRDRVALISFRSKSAELVLPPTRSLTRAKRCLAAMPGGGGTPLATALNAAATLAESIGRKGGSTTIVVMTDGRANIALDGAPGRARASEDAIAEARVLRAARLPCALVDTSQQPQQAAQILAGEMGALYLPLPHADAAELSTALRGVTKRAGPLRARAS